VPPVRIDGNEAAAPAAYVLSGTVCIPGLVEEVGA
jgi:hypothetical protein